MSDYVQFAVSLGLWMALGSLVAGIVFRRADVSLPAKIAVPATLVALGCYLPLAVNPMLGKPVSTTVAALPDRVQLLGFVPANDDETLVDLWLLADGCARSYEVAMTPELKKLLEDAQKPGHAGRPINLVKGHGKPGQAGGVGGSSREDGYDFDLSKITLPPKE